VHAYDARMDDESQAAIADESRALADFRSKVSAIDPASLSLDAQLDREQLLHAFDAGILADDTIKQWTKNPDVYSSASPTPPTSS
jgi:hypothetical protein